MRVAFHAGQLLQPVPGGIGRYSRAILDRLGSVGVDRIAFAAGARPAGLTPSVPVGRSREPPRQRALRDVASLPPAGRARPGRPRARAEPRGATRRPDPARRDRARHRVPADPAGHDAPRCPLPRPRSRSRSTRRDADHRAVRVHTPGAGTRRVRTGPVAGRAVRGRPAGASRAGRARRDGRDARVCALPTCSPSEPSSRARTSGRSATRSRSSARVTRA